MDTSRQENWTKRKMSPMHAATQPEINVENMQWKMWTRTARNMFHNKYVASRRKSEAKMQSMHANIAKYANWPWTTVYRCRWENFTTLFVLECRVERTTEKQNMQIRYYSTYLTEKKISGVAKHQAALSKEIKPYFECGAAHKSIRITKTEKKNATHVFLNGNLMRNMTESGPADHRDAHSAESNLSLTCGAQTYQSIDWKETKTQTDPTENKFATNAFPRGP